MDIEIIHIINVDNPFWINTTINWSLYNTSFTIEWMWTYGLIVSDWGSIALTKKNYVDCKGIKKNQTDRLLCHWLWLIPLFSFLLCYSLLLFHFFSNTHTQNHQTSFLISVTKNSNDNHIKKKIKTWNP